jgi:sugar lactone lactonase YvrE
VAGGRGAGSRADQLHCPRGVAVDDSGALLVADTMNHRVMRFQNPFQTSQGCRSRGSKRGELVAGGNGPGHRVNQLNQPNCIILDAEGALYIADTANHRVVRWHLSQQC